MKYLRIFLLLACVTVILARVENALWNPTFSPDQLHQLAGAINLLEGHGVSAAYTEAAAPEIIHYQPIVQSPPGYSWLTAAGIFLTGDLYSAVILNDLFFTLLQLVSAAWLLSLVPRMASYLKMVWFSAFALNTSLVTVNTAVDTAAMGGYTLALACLLYSMRQQQGSLVAGITAGIALTFCLVMRYAYLPQAFLIPAMLALIFLLEKNKDQRRFLVALTATLIIGFIMYYLLSPGHGIRPGYVPQVAQGLFPGNLIRFNYAFMYQGFFSASEWRLLVAAKFESAGAMFKVAVLISKVATLIAGMVAMIVLILHFVREAHSLFNKKRASMSAMIGNSAAFVWVLFGGMGCNLLLLVYLSLTSPMQTWAKEGWTFVQEARYYVPSWLTLWIVAVISLREKDGQKWWNSMRYWIPIILLGVNVVAFSYYKRLSSTRQPDYLYRATCTDNGINHIRVRSYSKGCEY